MVEVPRPIRWKNRQLNNPGCTEIVNSWIENRLGENREDGFRFTSTIISGQTGININRTSALLNALRFKNRIRIIERDGFRNIYFTTKKMFHSYKPRRRRPVVLVPRPEAAPVSAPVYEQPKKAYALVDQLIEAAIQVEKTGPTRDVCLNLIQTLYGLLREMH